MKSASGVVDCDMKKKTRGVKPAADRDGLRGTPARCECTGECSAGAHQKVLGGKRHRQYFATPPHIDAHWLHVETEALPCSVSDHHHDDAGDQDENRSAPNGGCVHGLSASGCPSVRLNATKPSRMSHGNSRLAQFLRTHSACYGA